MFNSTRHGCFWAQVDRSLQSQFIDTELIIIQIINLLHLLCELIICIYLQTLYQSRVLFPMYETHLSFKRCSIIITEHHSIEIPHAQSSLHCSKIHVNWLSCFGLTNLWNETLTLNIFSFIFYFISMCYSFFASTFLFSPFCFFIEHKSYIFSLKHLAGRSRLLRSHQRQNVPFETLSPNVYASLAVLSLSMSFQFHGDINCRQESMKTHTLNRQNLIFYRLFSRFLVLFFPPKRWRC